MPRASHLSLLGPAPSNRCRRTSKKGKLAATEHPLLTTWTDDMKSRVALAAFFACAAAAVAAQSPSSGHPRGTGLQAWQNPGLPAVLAKCKTPPPLNAERLKQVAAANSNPANAGAPPEWAPLPASPAIPGVIAAGQSWKVVWSWEGNNADGPIAGDNGTLLFANNDASNVMQIDPATGLATVALRQREHRWSVVAQQERRAVRRRARIGHGHRAAGAPAQDAGELLQRRAARVRRRRHQRPRGRCSRRRLHLRPAQTRRLLRQPAGRRLAVRSGRAARQRHHPEPGREDALRHQRRDRWSPST